MSGKKSGVKQMKKKTRYEVTKPSMRLFGDITYKADTLEDLYRQTDYAVKLGVKVVHTEYSGGLVAGWHTEFLSPEEVRKLLGIEKEDKHD